MLSKKKMKKAETETAQNEDEKNFKAKKLRTNN